MLFGSAMDSGLNVLLLEKDLRKAKDTFLTAWTTQSVDGQDIDLRKCEYIKYSRADLDEALVDNYDNNPNWSSLKNKGLLILDQYNEQIIPNIEEVYLVQKKIEIKNDQDDSFIGFIDFVAKWRPTGKTIVFDNKTSSVKYDPNAARDSEQLATYYEALKDDLKIDGVGYIVIQKVIRKKKLPKVQIDVQFGEISEELIEKTYQKYDDVLTGIRTGNFPCTRHEENGCCSTPWGCSYKRYCNSEGKDTTGLIIHKLKDQ